MGLFDIVKSVVSANVKLISLQAESEKLIIESGINLHQLNKEIIKIVNLKLHNYFMNELDGDKINKYDAAILKLIALKDIALHFNDSDLHRSVVFSSCFITRASNGKIKPYLATMASIL